MRDDDISAAYAELEPRLRSALAPVGAADAVDDAIGEAFAYLCANADRVLAMDNPGGYLYRVARSHLGRRRKRPELPSVPPSVLPQVEPVLPSALAALTEHQRVSVFLIAGLGWTAPEVAGYLDIGEASVRTHYRRGLDNLRERLGEVVS